MIIIDITNPIILLMLLILTILLIFAGKEFKKSYITVIPLFFYLALLVIHVMQLMTLSVEYSYLSSALTWSIVLDFMFVFITFISYLWVDDIEAKANNKKVIDNSLEWFWKDV